MNRKKCPAGGVVYCEIRPKREMYKNKPDAVVLLFFILFALGLFWFLKQNGLILCGPQQFFVIHPLQSYWLSEFFNGTIPWINNAVAGGIPIWADPNLAIFYPGNLIFLVLPFNTAWNGFLVLHLFWGPCGLYWLCRRLALPVGAALTGALAFLFSAPLLAALNSNEVLTSASWIPWVLGFTYFGLQQSIRRTLVASIALACQCLAGFTHVQALTFFLVVAIGAGLYWRSGSKTILLRLLALLSFTTLLTAIQWFPAFAWLLHSNLESFFAEPGSKMFPYPGGLAAVLFLFGFHNRILWFAPVLLLIDYFWFGGSPFLSFCFALGAAFGAAWILHRYPRPLRYLIPALVAIELLFVNWHVPQLLSEKQTNQPPAILQEVTDFNRWNIHQSGTRGALSQAAGLRWGLKYGSPPESGLMLWRPIETRTAAIEDRLRTGKSLKLLRDAGIVYVLSDIRFDHPELGLVSQNSTKFYLYRQRLKVSPLVVSSKGSDHIRWSERSSNSIDLTSTGDGPAEITIHRNALPGWRCESQGGSLPVQADADGWMKIQAPGGETRLDLSYRAPGAIAGTILTFIGTIFLLAFFLL